MFGWRVLEVGQSFHHVDSDHIAPIDMPTTLGISEIMAIAVLDPAQIQQHLSSAES